MDAFAARHRQGILYAQQNRFEDARREIASALALQPNDFLERRLQTIVFKQGLAKSIHHARVLIRQKHIR